MALSLTFTDLGTGSVRVTTAGGGAGDSNAIYTGQATNVFGATPSYTLQGTIVGNTTADYAVGIGRHWGYALTSGVVTGPYHFAVTNGETSIHYQCMEAVQAAIQALALAGVTSSNIVVRKLGTDRGADWGDGSVSLPAIVIHSVGVETVNPRAGSNYRDDIDYPIPVNILAADNQDLVTNHERYLMWREQIRKRFTHQRLTITSTGASMIRTFTQPGAIMHPGAWYANLWHSTMIIRCTTREPRG